MYHQRFKSEEERFLEKFDVVPSGCWEWRDCKSYPKFWTQGRYVKASRYALQKYGGVKFKPGQFACHHCDNPRCVNPDHLFVGTQTDNMMDRSKKGRRGDVHGEKNGRAKLNRADVAKIRKIYASGRVNQTELGIKFGISQTRISSVVRNASWLAP